MFGRTATEAFFASTIRARANKAWLQAGLAPITPHEARHCAISYFIAAGLDWKQISTWASHGDVRQTWNRYGHLIPGGEEAAAARLDAYLEPPDATLELVPEPPTTADDRYQPPLRQNETPDRTGDPTVAHPPENTKSPVNTGDSEYRYRDSNSDLRWRENDAHRSRTYTACPPTESASTEELKQPGRSPISPLTLMRPTPTRHGRFVPDWFRKPARIVPNLRASEATHSE